MSHLLGAPPVHEGGQPGPQIDLRLPAQLLLRRRISGRGSAPNIGPPPLPAPRARSPISFVSPIRLAVRSVSVTTRLLLPTARHSAPEHRGELTYVHRQAP